MSLHRLPNYLRALGPWDDATAAIAEAVSHYSVLAQAHPALFDNALRQFREAMAWLDVFRQMREEGSP
jgi:hypothetical protein